MYHLSKPGLETLTNTIYVRQSAFIGASYDRDSYSGSSNLGQTKHYEILRHAKERLNIANSPFDLIDCISNVKRAIDFRLKMIMSVFHLTKLLHPGERKLHLLERLGLAKALIIQDIYKIRNILEHQENQAPPSHAEAERYHDIAWYFLRSTDWLFIQQFIEFWVDSGQTESANLVSGNLLIAPDRGWRIDFRGTISANLLSHDPSPDFFRIKTTQEVSDFIKADKAGVTEDVVIRLALIDDAAALDLFGKLYFDLAAEML